MREMMMLLMEEQQVHHRKRVRAVSLRMADARADANLKSHFPAPSWEIIKN
jgi:hypothetical protein